MSFTAAVLIVVIGLSMIVFTAKAQDKQPKENIIRGELFPPGYTPMKIKNGVYPRDYYPNTEKLSPREMRVTALGTGMPNVITGNQKASCWYVELGNGEKFLFDVGSGSMENLSKLRPYWSKRSTRSLPAIFIRTMWADLPNCISAAG